jgi:hypothetical protein
MSNRYGNGANLSAEQLALLEAIQNRLIPAGDGMPGAGDVGCAASIDRYLSERPGMRRPVIAALHAVEAAAAKQTDDAIQDDSGTTHVAFLHLADSTRDEVLRAVETAEPELFATLLRQTYVAYYTNPVVLQVLGWKPPQPDGFAIPPPFDESLLENVKQRGKLWRDA